VPNYILVQDSNSVWQRAGEQDLPDEATLQRLIRENPEVLPLGDLGDDVPPLLVVGRETALPKGYVDVIGVDEEGLITLIECKLARNTEVKRKVIGQVLGYGAYLWGMSYPQTEVTIP
jgi:RecB family endonuclease NucS